MNDTIRDINNTEGYALYLDFVESIKGLRGFGMTAERVRINLDAALEDAGYTYDRNQGQWVD